ncbi:isomerase [Lentilactobacillus fungorum]|uniref:Isomerase n=1 Tax=Lentilactobacillus fungorum TaxID=2201250 RepID=A0ABQ3VYY5_9LACO|nr:SIS domain-containing protein [Lentilactobacillus fungorum]GHP13933.1 isomerase [Lentilactobacillus fungorum]
MNSVSIMHRVIEDEIAAVKNVEDRLQVNEKQYNQVIDEILNLKGRLIFTGVGKSGHIGEKLAATFASTGTPSFFMHATEAMHGDLGMVTKDDLVIDISNSGETKEAINPIDPIHRIGARIIGMTGNKESTLAQKSDYLLEVAVNGEADQFNLAPTKSSTAVLVVGDAIALAVSEEKHFTEVQFGMFHPGGALGQRLLKEGLIK